MEVLRWMFFLYACIFCIFSESLGWIWEFLVICIMLVFDVKYLEKQNHINEQIPISSHLVLFILPDKQRCHMGRQHVLQQQAVQVLPGLDLVLLRAVLILQQEVLAEAGLVLADKNTVSENEGTIFSGIFLDFLQPQLI